MDCRVKPGNDTRESKTTGRKSPMAYETIKYEVAEQILTITLNRPDKLNAFNGPMQKELIDAFDQADKDDDIRAIIVTGAGRSSAWPMARSTTAIPMCETAADRSRCASSNA